VARDYLTMAKELSLPELKRLLDVKQQLEKLERKRADLQAELARIEKEIGKLSGTGSLRRRKAVKKKVRKKAGKAAGQVTGKSAGKAARKNVKKSGRKKVVAKKAGKAASGRSAGKPKLEDLIAELITKHGGTMSVKEMLGAFKDGRLFKSKSKNFENVLRRTLSTSKRIVRSGRGIYKLQ